MHVEWKIKVVRDGVRTFMADVIIYCMHSSGKLEVQNAEGGSVFYDNIGSAVLPTFRIHEMLLPTLVEALKETGIQTKDESYTAGKLEATEDHLSDLRHLLKLDERIVITGK